MSQKKQSFEERIPLEELLDRLMRLQDPAVPEPQVIETGEKRPSRATVLKVIEGLKGV